ncbi:MAG: hypothetical protein HY348_13410, partial [Nitrospira defluvii]|nr:hypothetical protein [Nitrospira defluvii]
EEHEGRLYADRQLTPVAEPMHADVECITLTGLVALMGTRINELGWNNVYVHIESPKRISVREISCNKWGERQQHISCVLPDYGRFQFGQYMQQEAFIIGLQAFFDRDRSADMDYVLQIAGKLKAEAVSQADDNGVSQTVQLRKGVVLAENAVVKKIVHLRPYRTFREVAQPESAFIFRLKTHEGEPPTLSLFVADAEMWQAEAMQSIKGYLEPQLSGVEIIA